MAKKLNIPAGAYLLTEGGANPRIVFPGQGKAPRKTVPLDPAVLPPSTSGLAQPSVAAAPRQSVGIQPGTVSSGTMPAYSPQLQTAINQATSQGNPSVPGQQGVGNFRKYGRNFLLRPLLGLLGIDVPAYNDQGFIPQEDMIKIMDTLPPNVREKVDQLMDKIADQFDYMVSPQQQVNFNELEQITPANIAQQTRDFLPDTSFEPIEKLARQNFQQQTIPSLAERFAGLGGLQSTAFKGELGRAGSNLENQLAALRSQYGLQQGDLQAKTANILGNLGIGQAEALGRMRLGNQSNQLQQKQLLGNLLGLTTNRSTVGMPNEGQSNPWLQAGQGINRLASTMLPLLI